MAEVFIKQNLNLFIALQRSVENDSKTWTEVLELFYMSSYSTVGYKKKLYSIGLGK